MSDLQLFKDFSSLPAELQQQVSEFIEFLKTKVRKEQREAWNIRICQGFFQNVSGF